MRGYTRARLDGSMNGVHASHYGTLRGGAGAETDDVPRTARAEDRPQQPIALELTHGRGRRQARRDYGWNAPARK
jgi:hypothetical protein